MPKKKKKKIASKKTKAKAKTKTKAKAKTGPARRCSECGELGHNQRSHQPGGKLAA